MARQTAKLIGGPGTGKTAELMRVMTEQTARYIDPMRMGFVTFTRAARREAAARASARFGISIHELEHEGWFRTLHSVCKKCLGIREALLADNKESREWVENAIQERIGDARRGMEGFYRDDSTEDGNQDATRALQLWDAARNRLGTLQDAWSLADDVEPRRTPPLKWCLAVVGRYEQAKRLDHRLDFTDLLGRFAGWRFDPEYGAERCEPEGDIPEVEAWFCDEQQDTSALLDSVCHRLTESDACRWAYWAGDPFQSIYGWCGASPKWFLDMVADKTHVMPISYRCGAAVLALGEKVIERCNDYMDRRITPAGHESTVEDIFSTVDLQRLGISPEDEWMLLARTNFVAATIGKHLDRLGIPWKGTQGGGKWHAPVRSEAISALADLQDGAPIDGEQWRQILKYVPTGKNGSKLLVHGTKARFKQMEDAGEQHPWVMRADLTELGATEAMIEAIRDGKWKLWIPESGEYTRATKRWGTEAVANTKVRVGTIHSAKGLEADNVVLSTELSEPCVRGAASPEGCDEQRRVFYVGATRARHRLILWKRKVGKQFEVP